MSATPLDTPRFLPLGIDVRGKPCLVVGGGPVGTRKALTLSRAGAVVTVVAPEVTDKLSELVAAARARWLQEPFRDEHANGAFLVVAATDDDDQNAAIVGAAARKGALVCDASSGERSQVIFGATLRAAHTTIAVFTDGRDPAAARAARDRIAVLFEQR